MDQSYTLSPNKKKVILQGAILTVSILIGIYGIGFILKTIIPLDIVAESLSAVSPGTDLSQINVHAIVAFIMIAVITVFAINVIALKGTEYVLYGDRIEINKRFLFISLGKETVPYTSILDMETKGSVLMDVGTIALKLNDKKKRVLQDINNPRQIIGYIKGMIERNRAYHYAQYNEERKINKIMDRY